MNFPTHKLPEAGSKGLLSSPGYVGRDFASQRQKGQLEKVFTEKIGTYCHSSEFDIPGI